MKMNWKCAQRKGWSGWAYAVVMMSLFASKSNGWWWVSTGSAAVVFGVSVAMMFRSRRVGGCRQPNA